MILGNRCTGDIEDNTASVEGKVRESITNTFTINNETAFKRNRVLILVAKVIELAS